MAKLLAYMIRHWRNGGMAMDRRTLFLGALAGLVSAVAPAKAFHEDFWFDDAEDDFPSTIRVRRRKKAVAGKKQKKAAASSGPKRPAYKGRTEVSYFSFEKPGTLIIKTRERALYQVLGGGRAMRYLVAVGKEGFSWSGTARVGFKRVNPTWTPPAEMIERKPEYAEWADGMPGGIPENPLGVRALYLYQGNKDTLFRIHGTNAPSSIGTAASSGCIRMLNKEVVQLYDTTPIGTKVIVR
jgi:lipoprotein-anchoring transpeptidase ErfK/SrfK